MLVQKIRVLIVDLEGGSVHWELFKHGDVAVGLEDDSVS